MLWSIPTESFPQAATGLLDEKILLRVHEASARALNAEVQPCITSLRADAEPRNLRARVHPVTHFDKELLIAGVEYVVTVGGLDDDGFAPAAIRGRPFHFSPRGRSDSLSSGSKKDESPDLAAKRLMPSIERPQSLTRREHLRQSISGSAILAWNIKRCANPFSIRSSHAWCNR